MKLVPALLLALVLAPAAAQEAQEQSERERLRAERAAVEGRFVQEQQACHARFAVNDCVDDARKRRTQGLSDIRRQELLVNEAERKRRAAERLRTIDERNTPESQEQAARRRAEALESQKQNEARAAERAAKRGAEEAARDTRGPAAAPTGKLKVDRPADETAAARNRERHAERLRDAEARKKRVEQRIAEKKKPAASLPAPPR